MYKCAHATSWRKQSQLLWRMRNCWQGKSQTKIREENKVRDVDFVLMLTSSIYEMVFIEYGISKLLCECF